MKTTFAFLASIVVLFCTFSALVGRADAVDGVDVSFANQTFSENGTNLIATFDFSQDFAADALQCNFTFPGNKVFFKVMDRYLINFDRANASRFAFASDISGTTLSTGRVSVHNNNTITNGTHLVYYLYPYDQQKDFSSAFTLSAYCEVNGELLSNTTINDVVINNPKGGSSSAATLNSVLVALFDLLF